jgi:hypothetical protein
MRLRLSVLLVVAAAAVAATGTLAQSGYFGGATPRPPDAYDFPASLTVTRMAPASYGPPDVIPTVYTHLTTDPESRAFEWASLTILNNHSNYGENVASYSQANKLGAGPVWGGVFELQGHNPEGGWWGIEVDAMAYGPSTMAATGARRIGMGLVVGRAGGAGPASTVDYGYLLLPFGRDRGLVDVNYGFASNVHCRIACFAMNSGEKIAFDDGAKITQFFDPQTGFLTFATNGKPIFEFQMETGEIRVLGRAAQFVTAK